MACHVRRGDIVEVISGDHADTRGKGQRGRVLRVMPAQGLVLVEGVNMVYRHVRPSRRNPRGGRIQKEAPLKLSNVLPVDPKTDRPSRVRFEVETDTAGRVVAKRRVTAGGTVLGEVRRHTAGS